tara:strand:+ start:2252 stop:3127 length:876 start_codon:yes stop_codon:yes gene_type:complete
LSVPEHILKKVKLIEIKTRKVVNNLFVGEYHSAFKGQGMTFSEFREYVPGDDVRSISWTVTARTGKPYIKKYDEEREMNVVLAVDVSGSQQAGSTEDLKGEISAHLSALLGFSAAQNKDAVCLYLFSDQPEHYVPAKKGKGQIHRLLRDLYYFEPQSKKTSLESSLEYLRGVLKKKAHIFLISDFQDQNFENSLSRLSRKHDVVAVWIVDPFEVKMPKMGLVDFECPETGQILTVDTSSAIFQKEYRAVYERSLKETKQKLVQSRVDLIEVDTSKDIVMPLLKYFRMRSAR